MPIRLTEIYLSLDHGPEDLRLAAAKELGVEPGDVARLEVLRRAVDARRKPSIRFVYTVSLSLNLPAKEPAAARRAAEGTARLEEPVVPSQVRQGTERLEGPVVVIGAGPAGLFAAMRLAECGYAPLVVERGRPAEGRKADVARFCREGSLDPESNIVFGEGGAGAFSDGKLTHRGGSATAELVLRTLAECGAPADITFDARPHVGSDVLPGVLAAMRERIRAAGGCFRFGLRATGFELGGDRLVSVTVDTPDGREELAVGALLIAPGLSARDTWRSLLAAGVELECRPTLVGVRVEHPQEIIDRAQYGPLAGHPRLGPAEYFLKRAGTGGLRRVHSFCMCPGGRVIPVASSPGMVSANGMSRRARDSGFANAALVVPVGPADYGGSGPLAGVEFVERFERGVFDAGGGDYSLPAQRLSDFLRGETSRELPPSAEGARRRLAPVYDLLPAPVMRSIREAVRTFARRVRGFTGPSAGVYGAELRAGSPVRILRGEDGSSRSARNLFPAGEGAGYAGGIVSSAVDGLRQAERIVARYAPPAK